jgi:putative aldouronate transport system permease protein
MNTGKSNSSLYKKAQRKDNIYLMMFCVPTIVLLLIFAYWPMTGLVLAFKDFKYDLGMFGSPWVGFDNFWIFKTQDAFRIIRNTLLYGIGLLILSKAISALFALLLFEVRSKKALKFYQTAYSLPHFMSWVIVSYITYIFLSPTNGLINGMITYFGGDPVNLFTKPGAWPFIISIASTWKGIGLGSIIFYAALMGIDTELYEAAKVDGAGRFKQALYISLPALRSTIIILFILGLKDIMRGDFGLFYSIPRNVGLLYPTTDVIDTYIFRGLRNGNYSATTAVGLVQSVVGMIAVLISNGIVRKISPEEALY